MGVVYRAHDTGLDRSVALKFLPPYLSADKAAKERFLVEARAAAALDHPNVCAIHEVGEDEDGRLFIAMAYYEGETLQQKIAGGPLPIDEASDYARQIAAGLAAAHAHDIIHRDIKPGNVIVTPDGVAKVLDFGLAKLADVTLTGSGTTLGTVAYMSPEQLAGRVVDHRTDLWSLGVVLYEMVTGERPFKGDRAAAVIHGILHEPPEPPSALRPEIPAELESLLGRLLAKDPERRPASAEALELESGDTTAPKGVFARPTGWARLRSWRTAAALPLIAVAIIVGWALTRPSRGPPPTAIAVLPFQNLSADGPHAYFAGGLHDELLTQLAKVAALKVIGRTSVSAYAGSGKRLSEIGEELGVGSIVLASVQVVGDRLRVNVQLVDAVTEAHLWAEGYDGTLDDAFAIQSDVAQQVVAAVGTALGTALGGSEQQSLAEAPTANAEAYRFYLQGRDYYLRPGRLRPNLEIAQQLYERALELDPTFPLVHARLSEVHGRMSWYRYDPSPERVARQREEAETALRLAPDLPQAHVAMGLAHYWGRYDYSRALEEFGIALEGLPHDGQLWKWIGYVHRRTGDWEEALAAFEQAAQLDPRDADVFHQALGWTYWLTGRYAEAVRAFDRALTLAPDLHAAAVDKAWLYVFWRGELDTLRAVLDRLPLEEQLGAWRGTAARERAELLLYERRADSLLSLQVSMRRRVMENQGEFLPTSLYAAWAHQLRGDRAAARAAFESALVLLDSALTALPDDFRVHAARGLTLAGLGRREEALREAGWIQESAVFRLDAFLGLALRDYRARILAHAGEAEAALDEIERLLGPYPLVTAQGLRLDPRWDPIREHPRFQALLKRCAEP